MSEPLSSRFSKIFNDIPPEAHQTLLEKSLAQVLDQLPPDVAKKVYSSALKVRTKHENVPKLDLKGKRKQVNGLLDVLNREARMPMFGDRARREEIVSEIMQSLTGWLNDVWSTFYEHHVQYAHAHSCLLFVSDVLSQLDVAPNPGACKCELMNLPIRVTIKNKHGDTMTKLRVRGPQNVDRLLLWIWRDLALCMLARGTKLDKERVNNIIEDLETIYGFPVLERLLRGALDEEEADEAEVFLENESLSDEEEDADLMFDIFRCDFHSDHWDGKFADESLELQKRVENHLFKIFTIAPNLALHDTIMEVAADPLQSAFRASAILSEVAGNTSDTLAAALSIEVSKNNPKNIINLLDQYSYLLRPRDSVTLQCAAAVLGESSFQARGLHLLETGLQETLIAIQMAIRGVFVHVDEEIHKKELQEILKLRSNAEGRRDRVDGWVKAVMSNSSSGMPNPMAFASMLFGIPMMPGMAGMGDDPPDETDLLNFIDFEGSGDADLDDLQEELKPKLKQRFDGWTQLATVMKGGSVAAVKAYAKAVELMPFLRATDIVNEMVNRLVDRPSKSYVADALESVSSFCKIQRKKINANRNKEKEKQAAAAAAKATASNDGATPSASTPTDAPAATSSSEAKIFISPLVPPTPPAVSPTSPRPSNAVPLSVLPYPFTFAAPASAPAPPAPASASAPLPPPPAPPIAAAAPIAPSQQATQNYAEPSFMVFKGMEDVD